MALKLMRGAVPLPRFNEEAALVKVITGFRKAMPLIEAAALLTMIGMFLALMSIGAAIVILITHLEEGIVPRLSSGPMPAAVAVIGTGARLAHAGRR